MKKSIQNAWSGKSASSLEQTALAYFSEQRYKEATEIYKDLLKRWNDDFYRQQLAECYLLRALSMSTKGMPKEAVVLWENYADWASPPLLAKDAYILWLIAGKATQKAYSQLQQLTVEQLDENYPELASKLGFLIIFVDPEIAKHLPQDSTLLKHLLWVQNALLAYQNQQPEHINEALEKLPFRSAFRDFRTLLKAQQLSNSSIEQTQKLLAKIPTESPYRPAADVILAYTQQGSRFVETALSLNYMQRRIVCHAKGLTIKQIELLEALYKIKDNQTEKLLFNLAIQFRSLFGIKTTQDYCQKMLEYYPAGSKDFFKTFVTTDKFEQNRIQALLCERMSDNYDSWFYWQQCIKALDNKQAENQKRIALILRHASTGFSEEKAVSFIIYSLDYDPSDRNSYQKILDFYAKDQADASEYERWLEISMQKFPKDIDLLVRAVKSAAGRRAFKKAAKYAQELLKIDPVNTLAKHLLFANHLAHARRLIKTKKNHLVDKEIIAALQITLNKSIHWQAELLLGFNIWAAEDAIRGEGLISEALHKLNEDPTNIQFQAYMEASLLELSVSSICKSLPSCQQHFLSETQLKRLIELIKYYDALINNPKILFKGLGHINNSIQNSIQHQNYPVALLLAWCRQLADINCFELLNFTAKQAHSVRPMPIWQYYRICAEFQGNASNLDMMNQIKLQHALDEANAENDHKTVFLIAQFLESDQSYEQALSTDYDNPFYDNHSDQNQFKDNDEEDMSSDFYSELFGHLPDTVMDKLERKVQSIMMKVESDQYIADNIRKYSQTIDQKKLTKLFSYPDFLAAIAILDAASALQIEIGVRFEDIVYRFEHPSPQLSLPFY